MGFLWMLLIMCVWMIYGGSKFYVNECNVHFDGECISIIIISFMVINKYYCLY